MIFKKKYLDKIFLIHREPYTQKRKIKLKNLAPPGNLWVKSS